MLMWVFQVVGEKTAGCPGRISFDPDKTIKKALGMAVAQRRGGTQVPPDSKTIRFEYDCTVVSPSRTIPGKGYVPE